MRKPFFKLLCGAFALVTAILLGVLFRPATASAHTLSAQNAQQIQDDCWAYTATIARVSVPAATEIHMGHCVVQWLNSRPVQEIVKYILENTKRFGVPGWLADIAAQATVDRWQEFAQIDKDCGVNVYSQEDQEDWAWSPC